MGQHLFAYETDFITPTSVAATSEATDREAENVLTWNRPNRLFVGTGALASESLTFDLGATTTIEGLLIDNVNTIGVTVKGNATDAGGGSWTYDATHTESATTRDWGRERLYVDLRTTDWDTTGFRYLRLEAGWPSTNDGSSVWKVGGVSLFSEVTEFVDNFGFPLDIELFEPTDVQQRIGAPPEVSILGDKRFVVSLSQPVGSEDMDSDVKALLNVGTGRHVVFYRNNGILREAYMLRRTSRTAFSETGTRIRSIQNALFEEVA